MVCPACVALLGCPVCFTLYAGLPVWEQSVWDEGGADGDGPDDEEAASLPEWPGVASGPEG